MGYVGGKIASIVRPSSATRATFEMARHGGERMTELVRENTPIAPPQDPLDYRPRKRRRGTLRASWRQKPVTVTPRGFGSGVETEDPVAPNVEWSTSPHEIRPIPPNTRLAFVKDGEWHRPRSVRHPGTRGQAMLRIGAAKVEHELAHGLMDPELEAWKRECEEQF